jgi:rfaE bifunctional protein kinase chain/domain
MMIGLSREQCRAWLEDLPSHRIAVIGDVMLDHYYLGNVWRISPEAPVPVVELERETYRLGGAANVAHNLRMLGAQVMLCGVIGRDAAGTQLHELCLDLGIDASGLVTDPLRPTTIKTRVIGNNQQLLRLDREERSWIASDIADQLLAAIEHAPPIDAIIFEDYNKGVLTPTVIERTIRWARERSVPVFVDPKSENFFAYRGATVFKPNQKEAQHALGYELDGGAASLHQAGSELLDRLQARAVLITLGARGMFLIEHNRQQWHIPSLARHVADVSGAGDTVIATLAAMMVAGSPLPQAALLASIAAGVVCGEPGVVPITIPALLAAIEQFEQTVSAGAFPAVGTADSNAISSSVL